jgi:hypothetical protein
MRPLLLALALLVAMPVAAQVETLEPVDEAAADPSFVLFRARLLEAVAVRDTAFVLARLDPQATLSFGGASGVEGFRELWLDEDAVETDLWGTLGSFLPFGSTYDAGPTGSGDEVAARATVPYWFGAWPNGFDAFEHLLVVGESVNVRAAPSTDAPVLTQLSHALVRAESFSEEPWSPIVLETGETGYVASRYVRSPIGYRMGFVHTDGHWRITFFVAGD